MNGKGFRRDMRPAITHLRAEGRGVLADRMDRACRAEDDDTTD
jgi:hypothetical protein